MPNLPSHGNRRAHSSNTSDSQGSCSQSGDSPRARLAQWELEMVSDHYRNHQENQRQSQSQCARAAQQWHERVDAESFQENEVFSGKGRRQGGLSFSRLRLASVVALSFLLLALVAHVYVTRSGSKSSSKRHSVTVRSARLAPASKQKVTEQKAKKRRTSGTGSLAASSVGERSLQPNDWGGL